MISRCEPDAVPDEYSGCRPDVITDNGVAPVNERQSGVKCCPAA